MRSRLKIALVGSAVTALAAGGASLAFAGQSPTTTEHSVASAGTSTTSTTGPPQAIPLESVGPTATAPTTAAPNSPDPQVLALQKKLIGLGYWIGTGDGHMGASTQQGIYAFQKLHGLSRSGTFDAATVSAIDTAQRPTPASKSGDLIEVDKKHQVVLVVRDGTVLWAFNTSTGTESTYVTNGSHGFAHTPDGTFEVNRVVDTIDPGPLGPLYRPRYFTSNGIAIHGAGLVPPQPASHGCVRVTNAEMDFIWTNNLMPMHSTVWLYDDPAAQPMTTPILMSPPTTDATTQTVAPSVIPPVTTTAPTTTSSTTPNTTTSAVIAP